VVVKVRVMIVPKWRSNHPLNYKTENQRTGNLKIKKTAATEYPLMGNLRSGQKFKMRLTRS